MKKNKPKKLPRQLVALVGIFVLLIVVFIINNRSINKQLEKNPYENLYSEEDLVKIKGEFSCLPPKYPDRPHHDLCAFGIKEGDNYYQLQVRSDDEALKLSALSMGELLEIEGYLLEEESQIYQSLGTIEVLKIELANLE